MPRNNYMYMWINTDVSPPPKTGILVKAFSVWPLICADVAEVLHDTGGFCLLPLGESSPGLPFP